MFCDQQSKLLSLPPELLATEIFSPLHTQSLTCCLSTCRYLNALITSSTRLTYQRELEIAGMIDNPHCSYSSFPLRRRLEMLRERELRWSALNWKWRKQVKTPPETSGYYDVTPSIFLLGKAQGHAFTTVGVCSNALPSEKEAENTTWKDFLLGKPVLDFGTSIEEHDLLACISFVDVSSRAAYGLVQVHLIQHSTGLPHPLAAYPILSICYHPSPGDCRRLSIEISGAHLAIIASEQTFPETMYIWDWKRGVRIGAVPVTNSGLAFLRHDVLLHPHEAENCLKVYHITNNHVQLVSRLSFPELAPGHTMQNVQCRSDPSPTPFNIFPSYTRDSRPFANDPESAILLITFEVETPSTVVYSFALITHRKSLLQLALEAMSSTAPTSAAVAWEEWGPDISRIFPFNSSINGFITSTAGARWAWLRHKPTPFSGAPIQCVLEVVDFGPMRIRRAGLYPKEGEGRSVITGTNRDVHLSTEYQGRDSATLIPSSNVGLGFRIPLYSKLPCIRRTLKFVLSDRSEDQGVIPCIHGEEGSLPPQSWDGVAMDEERIIGIYEERDTYRIETLDMLYFG